MKNLFDPADFTEIRNRIPRIVAESQRQWGTMTAPQMMAHCSAALMMGMGELNPPRRLVGRIVGQLIKPLALGNDAPFKRRTPTSRALVVSGDRDLAVERGKLMETLDRFVAAGPNGVSAHPHPFFGALAPAEWSVLMYKHLDHHLRQFEA